MGFIIVHLILTIIYGIPTIVIQKQLGLAKVIIIFFVPYIGIFLILICDIFTFIKRKRVHDYSHLLINNEEEGRLLYYESSNSWLAPINDLLTISNKSIRRTAIINILKKDSINYVSQLKLALENEDTETAHYAAAALVELKSKNDNIISENQKVYLENKDNEEICNEFIESLYEYIELDILDEITLINYSNMLIECFKDMEKKEWKIPFKTFNNYCLVLQKINYVDREQEYKKFKENFKSHEEPYLLLLRYYFINKDKNSLEQIIKELKDSNVIFSTRLLQMIRFYNNGA